MVDDPGLLLIPEKLRDDVLYLAHDRFITGHIKNNYSYKTAF